MNIFIVSNSEKENKINTICKIRTVTVIVIVVVVKGHHDQWVTTGKSYYGMGALGTWSDGYKDPFSVVCRGLMPFDSK